METRIEVLGLRETLLEVRKVDRALFFKIRNGIKNTAEGLADRVVMNIPMLAPISGMRGSGRTAWGQATYKVKVTTSEPNQYTANPLVSIGFLGVGVNIADMAGRGGGKTRRSQTNTYNWRGTTRSHRVTSQGDAMIAALGKSPSRYIWPVAENAIPQVASNIGYLVDSYAAEFESNLLLIGKGL
jgi:hypothetical protein